MLFSLVGDPDAVVGWNGRPRKGHKSHGLFQLTGRSVRVPHEVEIPHRGDSPNHQGGTQQWLPRESMISSVYEGGHQSTQLHSTTLASEGEL